MQLDRTQNQKDQKGGGSRQDQASSIIGEMLSPGELGFCYQSLQLKVKMREWSSESASEVK